MVAEITKLSLLFLITNERFPSMTWIYRPKEILEYFTIIVYLTCCEDCVTRFLPFQPFFENLSIKSSLRHQVIWFDDRTSISPYKQYLTHSCLLRSVKYFSYINGWTISKFRAARYCRVGGSFRASSRSLGVMTRPVEPRPDSLKHIVHETVIDLQFHW